MENMENFTPYTSLAGGILLGISASILRYLNGRIAGISGMIGGILNNPSVTEKMWRLAFIVGLVAGAFVYNHFFPISIQAREGVTTPLLVVGGLLVGFGTSMGSGCTSGHGICGVSRFSLRSLTATAVFLVSGIVTVYVVKHMIGA